MGTQKHRTLVRSPRLLLFNPAVNGNSFAYVRSDARRSRLMVRGRHGHGAGRILLHPEARRPGALYSDALTDSVAYVTVLRARAPAPRTRTIVGVSRRHPKPLARARAAWRRQPPLLSSPAGGGANARSGGCA